MGFEPVGVGDEEGGEGGLPALGGGTFDESAGSLAGAAWGSFLGEAGAGALVLGYRGSLATAA